MMYRLTSLVALQSAYVVFVVVAAVSAWLVGVFDFAITTLDTVWLLVH